MNALTIFMVLTWKISDARAGKTFHLPLEFRRVSDWTEKNKIGILVRLIFCLAVISIHSKFKTVYG
jgi:hypothetical protein